MNWDTDRQYEEHRITEVVPGELGWSLYFESMGLFCPGNECEQAPAAGETARLYGKGFGYPVRGIVREGLMLSLEHQALGRRMWFAEILREPTRLLEWQDKTPDDAEGRFIDLTEWRS